MSSDDHNRSGKDVQWRQVGTGMLLEFRCPRCEKIRPTAGRRLWIKPSRLMQCANCVQLAEERKGSGMTWIHISFPRGHYIGQMRRRGARRWQTVTGKCKKPEKALANAVLKMSGDHKRARVLFIESSGWHEPTVCMDANRGAA